MKKEHLRAALCLPYNTREQSEAEGDKLTSDKQESLTNNKPVVSMLHLLRSQLGNLYLSFLCHLLGFHRVWDLGSGNKHTKIQACLLSF